MSLLERALRRAPSGEILRFGIVGVGATLTHLGLLRVGVEWFGASPVLANGLAFCVAVLVTYFGQSRWVFRSHGHDIARLRKFLLSVCGGLFLNVGIMALTVQVLGLNYLVGFVSGLVIIPAVTFVINKFWVFGRESGR